MLQQERLSSIVLLKIRPREWLLEPKRKVIIMLAKSVTKYLRISPRKLRLVLDTVRYKNVDNAFASLSTLKNKGARLAEKALKSAVSNAKILKMEEDRLFVSKIFADGGPTFKRYLPRAMGRADRLLKRTSHLTIILEEGKKSIKPIAPQEETSKPKKKKLAGKK